MAKYVYPAVFKKEGELYSVSFPDLESCYTSAASIQEGLEMANDVLCLTLYDLEQEGAKLPEPSEVNKTAHDGDSFVSLVACDTDWYRRFYESKSVKKTLSIPAWLNDLAEKNALNFSQVLQEALRNKLGVG